MITYHHIGGRSGTYPLPLKEGPLLKDFHLVLYDADQDCCYSNNNSEAQYGKLTILPYCIGRTSGRGVFNINYHPTTNSLYKVNPAYKHYNFIPANRPYGAYVLGDAFETIKKCDVDLYSLADVFNQNAVVGIDFLSMDIQGAEFDVIDGSHDLLRSQCLGILIEAEFVDMYHSQKTIFDVHPLLTGCDFELLRFFDPQTMSPTMLPVGFRAGEQLIYADAVYAKKLSAVLKTGSKEALYKWAFFVLLNQNVGLCLEGLRAQFDNDSAEINLNDPSYVVLLKRFWGLYKNEGLHYLPKFHELFSREMLAAYYQSNSISSVYLEAKQANDKKILSTHKIALDAVAAQSEIDDSNVERLFLEYGLDALSACLKANRVNEIKKSRELLENSEKQPV